MPKDLFRGNQAILTTIFKSYINYIISRFCMLMYIHLPVSYTHLTLPTT